MHLVFLKLLWLITIAAGNEEKAVTGLKERPVKDQVSMSYDDKRPENRTYTLLTNPLFPVQTRPVDPMSTGCGEVISEPRTFGPPLNNEGRYLANTDCTWILMAPYELMRVRVIFKKFSIENSVQCQKDSVMLKDGDEKGPLLAKLCGARRYQRNYPESPYESTGPMMTVKFTTNRQGRMMHGFEIEVQFTGESEACSGSPAIITLPKKIDHPAIKKVYGHNEMCAWFIMAPPDKYVKVMFESLNVEYHPDCAFDFIELHDGDNPLAPSIGDRLCGQMNYLPDHGWDSASRKSSGQYMYILFSSDKNSTGSGFVAKVTFVSQPGRMICSSSVKQLTDSGIIRMPENCDQYVNYAECKWKITAPNNGRVAIEFISMDIEASENCESDALYIFDGTSDGGFQKLCGCELPEKIISNYDSVLIVFKTDMSVTAKGFTLSYSSTSERGNIAHAIGVLPEYICETDPMITSLTISHGAVIRVPTETGSYANLMNCRWRLSAMPNHVLRASLTSIDIEYSNNCSKDYLVIYDGPSSQKPVLAMLCGRRKGPEVITSETTMYIHFHSDGDSTGAGFELVIHSGLSGACGSPLVAPVTGARITGGAVAVPHSWPWMVSLRYGTIHICGGAIVNNEWVITAAHCLYGMDIRNFKILAGAHSRYWTDTSERNRQTRSVSEVKIHPGYKGRIGSGPDIGLIHLNAPLDYDDAGHVHPVCLPNDNSPLSGGTKCVATGWGATSYDTNLAALLMQMEVPILNRTQCEQSLSAWGIANYEMCAGNLEHGGIDACQGDSGGPLVCYINGKYELRGVISWGIGCADPSFPGVYTRSAALINWINRILGT